MPRGHRLLDLGEPLGVAHSTIPEHHEEPSDRHPHDGADEPEVQGHDESQICRGTHHEDSEPSTVAVNATVYTCWRGLLGFLRP
ncbi:hypothetical protein CTA1_10538 [Colletotrichum tanaceti]|uniref:Uncharacterized protein n=1 Tax=Colletotrichum tanaceti TaxID=1306861 RepID=A0A4U6X482_9PEZI|nr:hypothetical protein CTA1_10538 [Colletotrichum tanaceti]